MENISPNAWRQPPSSLSSPTESLKCSESSFSSEDAAQNRGPTDQPDPSRLRHVPPCRRNLLAQLNQREQRLREQHEQNYTDEMGRYRRRSSIHSARVRAQRQPLRAILGQQNIYTRPLFSHLDFGNPYPPSVEERMSRKSQYQKTEHWKRRVQELTKEHQQSRGQENKRIPGNRSQALRLKNETHDQLRACFMTHPVPLGSIIMSRVTTAASMLKITSKMTEEDTSPNRYGAQVRTTEACLNRVMEVAEGRPEPGERPLQPMPDSVPFSPANSPAPSSSQSMASGELSPW